MASHHQPSADILPFGQPTDAPGPRFVKPIPPVDLYEQLAERPVACRGLLDHIADVLGTPFGLGIYIGFVTGSVFTVIAALLWSLAL